MRSPLTSGRRTVKRIDTRPSKKIELGTYLCSIDWSILDSIDRCEDKLQLFLNLVKTGFDTIMPLKTVKRHVNDAPWINSELKELIILRQKAFAEGDTEIFKHYRNIVNRERKCYRSRFYAAQVENLKDSKPS